MKFSRLLCAALLMAALTASSASTAKAQGFGNLGLSYLYGYGGFNAGYSQSVYNSSLPYFSLHPPVYYGKRYTRPYGVSPFASWPQLQSSADYKPTPHVARTMLKPLVINNPCYPASAKASKGDLTLKVEEPTVIQPLVIENPYFKNRVQYTSDK